ncbi:hypothetical protein ACFPES_24460 [Paenibacillus sp. GCM10023248]|uniref:hypothetical protein n=1 Tax=unclassified Paenibacillus TaxID=185978 RepID=UPI002379E29C|nr:hypothetical protein [Paenibacillus sp. MAHUQ-63]MDD9270215.1 hypothetical protein [Paenibacillus sp. MAHUQ-63]
MANSNTFTARYRNLATCNAVSWWRYQKIGQIAGQQLKGFQRFYAKYQKVGDVNKMTQSDKQTSMDITNELNQHTTKDTLAITDEVKDINDRIKVDTTPETCRADLDGN